MKTDVSTRNRGPRQQSGSRPARRPAAGQSAAGQSAAGQRAAGQRAAGQSAAGQSAAGQSAARASRTDQPVIRPQAVRAARAGQPGVRQAGLAAPRARPSGKGTPGPGHQVLRPPGTGQRPSGSSLPGARPAPDGTLAAVAAHVPRTRFILLVLGMLSGGLVCLLVINTTLAAASFRINALRQGNVALAQQEQSLQQQVTTEESPSSLRRRALKLGLRTQPLMNFLDLRTGHIYRAPATLPGIPNVPGYAP